MKNISRKNTWILIGLLMLSIGFWLWSVKFVQDRMPIRSVQQQKTITTVVPKTDPMTDDKLEAEINIITQSNIAEDMTAIDTEFK